MVKLALTVLTQLIQVPTISTADVPPQVQIDQLKPRCAPACRCGAKQSDIIVKVGASGPLQELARNPLKCEVFRSLQELKMPSIGSKSLHLDQGLKTKSLSLSDEGAKCWI